MQLESFGKYLLLEKLAAGGMAEVYLAKSIGANGINKFVAIKRILPQYSDNPEFIDMFKEEAKIAVNLNHSNIVTIYDFGIEKHQFFLVMEFVEGQNLRQILNFIKKENKDFSIDQISYLIKEVAAGLDHAHRCLDSSTGRPLNITHRDMSPQNVMVSFEGEVKVVDFGIAKAETQMESTRAGTIKGKFGYMSPEQAEGQIVDPRTDVFSLGIVLWELLAKDRLFAAQNEAATLKKVRDCQIPSLRKMNPAIPAELERICLKALAKDKSLRYQTAAAFHKDLNRFLNTQYPDFSAQEFSKFIKSVYHKTYLENRKKFAEYLKIQSPNEERGEQTATLTSTETGAGSGVNAQPARSPASSGSHLVTEDKLKVEFQSSRVDLNQFRQGENSKQKIRPPGMTGSGIPNIPGAQGLFNATMTGTNRQQGTHTGTFQNRTTITRTGFSRPASGPSMDSWLWIALFVVGLAGGGWMFLKGKSRSGPDATSVAAGPKSNPSEQTRTNSPPPTGQIESASRQMVPLNIQSRPQGAVVYINGKNVGITPYIGHTEAGKEFQLVLRREGFLPYERPSETPTTALYRLEATLQPEPPMGYLSIEVVGGGTDPVITVNGQRLDDKSQLSRYPVPAGTQIKVRAVNPFAQSAAEEVVWVGQSQKRHVRLILNRQSGAR